MQIRTSKNNIQLFVSKWIKPVYEEQIIEGKVFKHKKVGTGNMKPLIFASFSQAANELPEDIEKLFRDGKVVIENEEFALTQEDLERWQEWFEAFKIKRDRELAKEYLPQIEKIVCNIENNLDLVNSDEQALSLMRVGSAIRRIAGTKSWKISELEKRIENKKNKQNEPRQKPLPMKKEKSVENKGENESEL